MKEFLLSSEFLWSAIGLTSIGGIIAVLWRNTVWEARGITPEGDVERLRGGGIAKLLPKSATAWYVIAGVVLAVTILWMLLITSATPSKSGVWSSSLQSPSVATVVKAVWDYWLWILVIWGIFIALIEVNGWPKGLHWVTSGVVVLLFIVLPFIGLVNEPPKPVRSAATLPSPEACTKSRPCAPLQQADGSTEEVLTPVGKSLCFDDSFFANVSRLGYATSYQGGTEMSPGCTTVSCKMDSFRFTPQPGVGVPKYWFVREGASRC